MRRGVLTPAPRANQHRSASKAPCRSTAKGSPRDRTNAAYAAFSRSAAAVREAHRRSAGAAHARRAHRVPAPVRARRGAARGGRVPHRSGGTARCGLDGPGDGLPPGRRPRRDLERRTRAPRRRGGRGRGPRDARPRRPGGPQRLVPHGQSAAPPAVGPQRGGLLGGPEAHLRDRHGVHPGPARRPPRLLAHGPRPQALARPQQRDEPGHHLLLGPPARAARVRPAGLPRDRRGGRGGGGDAGCTTWSTAAPTTSPPTSGNTCAPGRTRTSWSAPTRAPPPTWSTPSTTSTPTRRRPPPRSSPGSTASRTTARTVRRSWTGSEGPWRRAC